MLFVHGFGCASNDWDPQVSHFSARHQTIVVDLRGHGDTAGEPGECSIQQYADDVAGVLRSRAAGPVVLVGHSMGCRVVVEAALQAPDHVAALILVDGSQFVPAMEGALRQSFAAPGGYAALIQGWFKDMFTPDSDPDVAAAAARRALRLPQPIGETLLLSMVDYDVNRLGIALAALRVPVLAIQATYTNQRRERRSLTQAQMTPYLQMLRERVPTIRIEIIPGTGHFPHVDVPARTNALIDDFLASSGLLDSGRHP